MVPGIRIRIGSHTDFDEIFRISGSRSSRLDFGGSESGSEYVFEVKKVKVSVSLHSCECQSSGYYIVRDRHWEVFVGVGKQTENERRR